ncbi:unnamed protein product [marine sediment metagenome]|uniref:Uncharacterized protein n=1 Tax=marine sediment metagenome TaxID=412755 RepID=X1KLG7_9ZZZZ
MVKDFEITGDIKSDKQHYVLCVNNEKYQASLEARKIYQCVPDPQAKAHGQIRVIDELGEDYLYPRGLFIPIEIPKEAIRAFAQES